MWRAALWRAHNTGWCTLADSLCHAGIDHAAIEVTAVNGSTLPAGFVPYVRYSAGKAIIICGNPTAVPIQLVLKLPFEAMGQPYAAIRTPAEPGSDTGAVLESAGEWTLEDLWLGVPARTVSLAELGALKVTVPPDQTARGGLAVLKLAQK